MAEEIALAYYQGKEDGLKEGIHVLKKVLEGAQTLDDVLKEYNQMVLKAHDTYEKIMDIQEANPHLVLNLQNED